MHFTLQQLRLLEAVSRHGSYTRAANELHLTQPAVSIQMKRLEVQLDLQLFEMVGKKILLTTAGREVYQAAQDILLRVDQLKNSLDRVKGQVQGPIQISVVTTAKYFMPHLLGQFLHHYPAVEPILKFTNRAKVIERLLNHEDDFVIMGQIPEDARLESYPFLNNVLGVVAPPDHPLANESSIPLKRLVQERFLTREIGSGTRYVFDQLLEKQKLIIDPYMELGSGEALKQGVMAGLGIAVLSLHSVQLERETDNMVVLDVEGFPLIRRWYAVHLKGIHLSLAAQTFLDFMLEEGEKEPYRFLTQCDLTPDRN